MPEAEQHVLDLVLSPLISGNMFTVVCLAEDELWGFKHQVMCAGQVNKAFGEKSFAPITSKV